VGFGFFAGLPLYSSATATYFLATRALQITIGLAILGTDDVISVCVYCFLLHPGGINACDLLLTNLSSSSGWLVISARSCSVHAVWADVHGFFEA